MRNSGTPAAIDVEIARAYNTPAAYRAAIDAAWRALDNAITETQFADAQARVAALQNVAPR